MPYIQSETTPQNSIIDCTYMEHVSHQAKLSNRALVHIRFSCHVASLLNLTFACTCFLLAVFLESIFSKMSFVLDRSKNYVYYFNNIVPQKDKSPLLQPTLLADDFYLHYGSSSYSDLWT